MFIWSMNMASNPGEQPDTSINGSHRLPMLWNMIKENYDQARHHEVLRAQLTSFCLVLGGVIATFVVHDSTEHVAPRALFGLVLMILGVIGAVMCNEHYERNREHVGRAVRIKTYIDRVYLEGQFGKTTLPERSRRFDLWRLWLLPHGVVFFIGLIIIAWSLLHSSMTPSGPNASAPNTASS